MPEGSVVYIYGRLSSDPVQIDPWKLLFQRKAVRGFWFTKWIEEKGMIKAMPIIRQVLKEYRSGLENHFSEKFPLSKVHDAIALYEKNMDDKTKNQGKISYQDYIKESHDQ